MRRLAIGPARWLLLLVLGACGGGDEVPAPTDGPATLGGTLAYVVTECSENPEGVVARQKLQIRRGEQEVTVKELSLGPLPSLPLKLCSLYATSRIGDASVVALPFQRLGISPDGSTVVVEVSDDHSVYAPYLPGGVLPPGEEEGIFAVAADGTGWRRLGPASREAGFRFIIDPAYPLGVAGWTGTVFSFSPDSRTIAFTDLGPGPSPIGEEAIQIVTLDVATGARTQITHLPSLTPLVLRIPAVLTPYFLDDEALTFWEESEPEEKVYTVKVDGTSDPEELPPPVAIEGAHVIPDLSITQPATSVFVAGFREPPVNNIPGGFPTIAESFAQRGENIVQLTNFRRSDTASGRLDLDQQRVVLRASADPLGTNPYENCQFFSIDTLGGGVRQVTHFGEGIHATGGCTFGYPEGCFVGPAFAQDQRPGPDTLGFYLTCDPLGTNPRGGQLFAMRADGTGLRQLTHTRGAVIEADGTVTVELPGPFAYAPPVQ